MVYTIYSSTNFTANLLYISADSVIPSEKQLRFYSILHYLFFICSVSEYLYLLILESYGNSEK